MLPIAFFLVGLGAGIWLRIFPPRSTVMKVILGLLSISFLIYGLSVIILLEVGPVKFPLWLMMILGGIVGAIAMGMAHKHIATMEVTPKEPSSTKTMSKQSEQLTRGDLENMEKRLTEIFGDALEKKYPLGYFLFASDKHKDFIPLHKESKPDYSFDWKNCRIRSISDSIATITLKSFHYYPTEIQIKDVDVILERGTGAVASGIFFNHIGLFVEIIDDRRDAIIYVIGFRKVEHVPKTGGVDFNVQKYIIFQNITISSVKH